jgi:hypothetical protein
MLSNLNNWLQLAVALGSRIWRVLVLLNVESTQQHDCLLSEDPSIAWITLLKTLVGIDWENTSISSESIIATPIIDASDAVLSQGRSTHDTGLDGDVEISLLEFVMRETLEELGNGEEFSVSSTVE